MVSTRCDVRHDATAKADDHVWHDGRPTCAIPAAMAVAVAAVEARLVRIHAPKHDLANHRDDGDAATCPEDPLVRRDGRLHDHVRVHHASAPPNGCDHAARDPHERRNDPCRERPRRAPSCVRDGRRRKPTDDDHGDHVDLLLHPTMRPTDQARATDDPCVHVMGSNEAPPLASASKADLQVRPARVAPLQDARAEAVEVVQRTVVSVDSHTSVDLALASPRTPPR